MFYGFTITKYLLKSFLWHLLFVSLIVIVILIISSTFDVFNQLKTIEILPNHFWKLITYKVPFLYNEVSAIVVFISTILFLHQSTIKNELIIILSSGMSVWRVYLVPVVASFLYGIIILFIINPIGTYGLNAYDKLQDKMTGNHRHNLIISKSGIFFFEKYNNTNNIIQAQSISVQKNELHNVTILNVDSKNNFVKRIDAKNVILLDGYFEFINPIIITHEGIEKRNSFDIPTNLSTSTLIQRITAPELILTWNLRQIIDEFAKSGVSTTSYKIFYYKQLLKPLILVAMVCIACCFIYINTRESFAGKILIIGIAFGVVAYLLLEVLIRMLSYGGLDPLYAIILPVLFILLVSNFAILHFQEA